MGEAGMELSMSERRVMVKVFAERYRTNKRGGRSALLDEFVAVTGYNRSYAGWLLRHHGKRVRLGERTVVVGDATQTVRRRRPRVYGPEVVAALKPLWRLVDHASGKRLAAALPEIVKALERHGELKVEPDVRAKLVSMSAATIDRVLAPERRRMKLKHRGGTKPGTLLKHQIPVRTFAEWDDVRPGFVEVDLVDHDGGAARGEFLRTLTMTDVATGWTELGVVPTKAQVWVFEEIAAARQRLPFPLLGLDSDNGGEFINNHLAAYCAQEQITFTRSRPYRKNDSCFVEQKNWSVVRRFAGHGRLEGATALHVLQDLYGTLRLHLNFFLPSAKLIAKERQGSRVRKRYDRPQTPYARILASPHVTKAVKASLRALYPTLNPAALMRTIRRLQVRLLHLQAAATPTAWTPRTMDGDGSAAKASGFPTAPWKTPPGFPTPPTASTTTRACPPSQVDFS